MPPPSKRRKLRDVPKTEEINFDLSARQEYLTGFHKRKVQRTKQAQEAAEKRAREEKITQRKMIRDERKADLERHVAEVNALLKSANGMLEEFEEGEDGDESVDGWKGIEDEEPPPIDHEAEYIDEDKYTTVTIETMDVSRDGLAKLGQDLDKDGDREQKLSGDVKSNADSERKPGRTRDVAGKQKGSASKVAKKKRKKFRYESKAERKVTRVKERSKNSKQAKARRDG